MVKFMILFHTPADPELFEEAYTKFLALVEQMPGIRRRQVVSVLGSPRGESPYYRILEVYFDTQQAMEGALITHDGQLAGAQLSSFPPGSFEMLFADVYEEDGGRTP